MTTPATVSDDLISAAQGGDTDAMWEIVSLCEPLLAGIVRQVAPAAGREDAEDLLQEARAALVERIRLYSSTASAATLQTYAYRSLRSAVAESWTRMSSGLSVEPSTVIRIRRALAHYEGNREAAFLSVNAKHDMDRSTFMAALEAMNDMDRWDSPLGSDGDSSPLTLADVVADTTSTVTDPSERRDLADWLLRQIDSRQSYALRSYYGVGMEKAGDPDVSAHLRVTPAVVRKLRERGISAAQRVAALHDIAA